MAGRQGLFVWTVILTALAPGGGIRAQATPPLTAPLELPGVMGYDAAVPSPALVLGGPVGSRHLRTDELVSYFRAVAEASDRVVFREHGRTYEGRPLVHAIVTSPANHARLEEIQSANRRLSDDPHGVSDEALSGLPLVVYLGHSVHGNEASGSDASALTLHHLAAGEGPAVQAILEHAVVLIDPSLNPDGRARFVGWVTSNRGRVATSDPADREHNEPWPGGRTNHYLFDLNRDWLPAAHPESRARLTLYHDWRPQLHTDFHEMGGDASFFFQPGVPSRDNPNTPAETIELTGRVAEYHARALDRIGQLYYSREQFDDFYYGKGSTYPDVNGAVGILFEQASSRSLLAETSRGLLSYGATVRNQFLTGLSTLEAGVALRTELLRNHRDHYAGASDFARSQPVRGWVLSLEEDRTRAQALLEMLQRHRIEIFGLSREVTGDGGVFRPEHSVVVPLDQPQARLLNGIMERRTTFQDSLFYDVSTWTAALSYGVREMELRVDPAPFLEERLGPVVLDGGEVRGGEASYAYLLTPDRYHRHRALHRLQDQGVQTLVATRPMEVRVAGEARTFPRGTIVIPVTSRDEGKPVPPDSVHRWVRAAAEADQVVFHAVGTGLNVQLPDLGSPSVIPLAKPSVALLSGSGTNAGMVGESWHLLNERMGVPVSLLDVGSLGGADLSRYTTIIVAGASPPAQRLEAWVRGGGVLIALGSSAVWAVREGLLDADVRPTPEADGPVLWEDRSTRDGALRIGGSIFEAELDPTHPVAYGFSDRIALFRNHNLFVEPSGTAGGTVARYSPEPLLSGYLHPSQEGALAGSAAILAGRLGQGAVVGFLDNPNFRAFWYGTNGLFLNAIFFGGIL